MNNREKVLWSGSLYVLGIRKGSENMSRSRREPRDGGIVPVKAGQNLTARKGASRVVAAGTNRSDDTLPPRGRAGPRRPRSMG